jgi:hypothetical protein
MRQVTVRSLSPPTKVNDVVEGLSQDVNVRALMFPAVFSW